MAANPLRRELNILLSTGELTSMSPLAIRNLGVEAVALTGGQSGSLIPLYPTLRSAPSTPG